MENQEEKARMRTLLTGTSSKKGVTFLELVLVLAILSFVFTLAMPSFSLISLNRARKDAHKTASALRQLSAAAVTKKEDIDLTVDLENKVISWTTLGEKKEEKSFITLDQLFTPSLGSVRAGKVIVRITSLGAQENIELSFSEAGEKWRVILNPLSGRVVVKKNRT